MKNVIKLLLFSTLFLLIIFSLVEFVMYSTTTYREPVHAGKFYPGEKTKLNRMLDMMLRAVQTESKYSPKAIIVPHAGYQHSGNVAAHAFKLLEYGKGFTERVIILAPSHYAYLDSVVVNENSYKTPLGVYKVDKGLIRRLKKEDFNHSQNIKASTMEHSDEVLIPFLIKVLPDAKMIPIIIGDLNSINLEMTAKAISKIIDGKTIIVVSSDFTHYGKNFKYTPSFKGKIRDGIFNLDKKAIDYILDIDLNGFQDYLDKTKITICGRNPIRLLLKIFELNKWTGASLLKYSTSADLTGDWHHSVSYASIALGRLRPLMPWINEKFINQDEQKALLKLARDILVESIKYNENPDRVKDLKNFIMTDSMKKKLGVFVTLKKKGHLRGCIGSIVGRKSVVQGIIENTINASIKDPRFPRVAGDELKDINIEISIITPFKKVKSLDEIKVGRDGLLLRNGLHQGILLPQVPLEQKWNKTKFLERLSLKAGLPASAYQNNNSEIYRFSAQVFGENF